MRTPAPPSLSALLQSSANPSLILVGVDLEEPGNVGALVRTALAAGATAFAGAGNGDPFCVLFVADINHLCLASFVQVCQILTHS